jgi:hypothetical protein
MNSYNKYEINNKSFESGPLCITQEGNYYFSEDIVINFYKNNNDFWAFNKGHNFGFMAGIIVEASNVVIDMCGFSIKQSIQDYCLQRFFALIQLNNMPFNVGKGPILENRTEMSVPENIVIKNGTFELTSHQAILGNNNKNLTLTNICVKQFEVTGITLNNIDGLKFNDSVVRDANKNIPLSPFFSAFVFLFRLLQTTIEMIDDDNIINKINLIIDVLKKELDPFINIIFNIESVDELYFLDKYCFFINKKKLSPCNIHGIKITGSGPGVDEFHGSINPDDSLNSSCIDINNVNVKNISARVDEELALAYNDKIVHIGAGVKATFTFLENNFSYKIIKLIRELVIEYPSVNTYLKSDLSDSIVFDSVEKIYLKQKLDDEQSQLFSVLRNADSMGHVNKGVVGLRLGSMIFCRVNKFGVNNICNYGKMSNNRFKFIHEFNIHKQTFVDHGISGISNITGSYSTGIIASSLHSSGFNNIDINNILSTHSHSVGFFVNNKSDDVTIKNIFINKIKSNNKLNDSDTILVDENTKNVYIYNTFINVNKDSYKFKFIFLFFTAIVVLYILNAIPFSVVKNNLIKYINSLKELVKSQQN